VLSRLPHVQFGLDQHERHRQPIAADDDWHRLDPARNTFATSALTELPDFVHNAEAIALEDLLAEKDPSLCWPEQTLAGLLPGPLTARAVAVPRGSNLTSALRRLRTEGGGFGVAMKSPPRRFVFRSAGPGR
jgi:hypothetical protein